MFRDQVIMVRNWFERWSPCEQTVALVAMIRKIPPTQARFLISALNRQIADCTDLRRIEHRANDPHFVASLNNAESNEMLMMDLLTHLPLLNTKNLEVKCLYLNLICKVLKYVVDHYTLVDEARQLLSYSLIHPAFTQEDRGKFTSLLESFEKMTKILACGGVIGTGTNSGSTDQVLPGTSACSNYPTSGGSPPLNELWQQQQQSNMSGSPGNYGKNYHRIRRSNSLTPPVLHSDAWTSQEELCAPKPRSLSLSSEVSPQSSLASSGSGSETQLDDPRSAFTNPGMKDVPSWLKTLRLHKYATLFAHSTYEEMLSVTEDILAKKEVTKGARHKIVLSVGKLLDRVNQLKQFSDLLTRDKDSLRNVLTDLNTLLGTPIKPPFAPGSTMTDADDTGSNSGKSGTGRESTSGTTIGAGGASSSASSTTGSVGAIGSNRPLASGSEDQANSNSGFSNPDAELTAWIVHVIGKACELNPDADAESQLVGILERCLIHEAFDETQKRRMTFWRQQHTSVRRNSVGHPHYHGHHHRGSGSPAGNGSSKHGNNGGSSGNGARHFSPKVLNLNNQHGTSPLTSIHHPWGAPGSSIHAVFMAKRPSLQDQILESNRSHLSVQRTKSAPLPNFLSQALSASLPITQFDALNPLGGGGDYVGGISFADTVASLGLGRDHVTSGMGHEHGLPSVGVDTSGFDLGQPSGTPGSSNMSALDITSRLESLCLSMTEAALGLSCTNY